MDARFWRCFTAQVDNGDKSVSRDYNKYKLSVPGQSSIRLALQYTFYLSLFCLAVLYDTASGPKGMCLDFIKYVYLFVKYLV